MIIRKRKGIGTGIGNPGYRGQLHSYILQLNSFLGLELAIRAVGGAETKLVSV